MPQTTDWADVQVVGIPRALLFYRFGVLWTTFFESIGRTVVVSDPTDKAIADGGDRLSVDECCLASKIYLGHVASLVDSDACDAVFVPSIANVGRRRGFCTKFQALPDLVANTFRDRGVRVASCLADAVEGRSSLRYMTNDLEGSRSDKQTAERKIAELTAKEEGKPEQIIPRIVDGRLNGFFKDVTLLEQQSVSDDKKTVGQLLKDNGVTVKRFVRFAAGA